MTGRGGTPSLDALLDIPLRCRDGFVSPMAGHLKKQNPKFQWLLQQRYVVLQHCVLKWFSSELIFLKSAGQDARGFLNLAELQCVVHEDGGTGFTVGPAGGLWKISSQ